MVLGATRNRSEGEVISSHITDQLLSGYWCSWFYYTCAHVANMLTPRMSAHCHWVVERPAHADVPPMETKWRVEAKCCWSAWSWLLWPNQMAHVAPTRPLLWRRRRFAENTRRAIDRRTVLPLLSHLDGRFTVLWLSSQWSGYHTDAGLCCSFIFYTPVVAFYWKQLFAYFVFLGTAG